MYGAELWLAGFIVLIVAVILVSGLRVRLVHQHKRLVVYRLGNLHRIIGPGIVWWYALIDREVREIEIQEEPFTPSVDGVLVNGLPVQLILNLWFAFDPAQAIGPGRDQRERKRLGDLLELSEAQREEQALVLLREEIGRQLAVLARNHPLPTNASVIAQLMPVFPGTPQRETLMTLLHAALKAPLAQIGYLLSDRPITIVQFQPPQDLISAFSRNRIIEQLRQTLPDLSDETVAQIIASIEGRPQMNVQKLHWEGNIPSTAHLEYQPDRNDLRQKVNVGTAGQASSSAGAQDGARQNSGTQDSAKNDPAQAEELSATDLAVLKRVPPSQRRRQASA